MKYSAFESHYDEYKHKIYNYLYYRSGRNVELAEDLTSEVFLKALEKFHTFKKGSSFQSWIYAIAHNHLVDYFRKNKESVDLELLENVLSSDRDSRSDLLKRESLEQVRELMRRLSNEEKNILVLRYQQNLSMRDISEVLDRAEPTVRVIVHRAIKKMRKQAAIVSMSLFLFIFLSFI